MLVTLLNRPHDVTIVSRSEPEEIPPGFVRVAIKSVGICGSDVHYYEKGRIGDFVLRSPMVLGHESAGIVDQVGEGVSLVPGQVVALEPGIPCGRCRYCLSGHYNLCPDVKFFATPPVDGALQEYVVHPAQFTFPAEGLSPDEACLAEPLSVGVYAARRASVGLGDKVLVIGAGPVGLATAFASEAQGGEAALTDVASNRIATARAAGFSASFFNSEMTGKYDVVFECTGTQSGISDAQRALRPGGVLALIGMGQPETMQLNGLDLNVRGITVIGIFRYANTYPSALALIRRYRDRMKVFQGSYVDMTDLPQFLADRGYQHYVKTIVHVK